MTTEDNAHPDRQLDDERAVDALLAEAGFAGDPGLRQVLLQLRAIRVSEVPAPSPRLAALLDGAEAADAACCGPGRARAKHIAVTTLAVAASFGIAGGAAAGGGDFRGDVAGSIETVVEWFSPPAPAAPAPEVPAGAPTPGSAVVSAPGPGVPAATPARDHLPAPRRGTAKASRPPATGSQDNQAPAPDVPGLRAKTEDPVDTAGQAGQEGKAAEARGGAAPTQAGHAATPGPDAVEGKAGRNWNGGRPDAPAPPPIAKAKAGPGR